MVRRAHCLRQKCLPRTCMRARLAAAGTEHAIYTSSPAIMLWLRRRACNHTSPETATSLALQPCSSCCLQDGHRRRDLQGSGTCFTLSIPTASSSVLFHYVLACAANCTSLWLLPTPSGVGTIARGNTYVCLKKTRSRTLSDSREAMRAPLHPRLTSDPPSVIEIHDRRLHDP